MCGQAYRAFYDQRPRRVRDLSCGDRQGYLEVSVRRVPSSRCGGVKRERLDWLADNPLYTKRFALFVGRRRRESIVQAVAKELHLHWHTVKELDKEYMREQLRRAGCPAPRVIGIDEIAVGKRHRYRIVVSDLERGQPIWFGGQDRSEASLDEFFAWLGPKKCRKVRLAAMDMWRAFRKSTLKEGHAPQARMIYDMFHVLNLEMFLRSLKLPMTISVGEPKRNRDYHKVHFPKRSTDDTESQAMARFAVVELPAATPAPSAEMAVLREVAGRLQAQVKQKTQAVNRLHNLLARAFPELSTVADDIAVGWVLQLLETYPTAERLADAEPAALETIPFVTPERAHKLHQAAGRSVATLRGPVAEALVRLLVTEVRLCQKAEKDLRRLLATAFANLPASPHVHVVTIPGIGEATAAVLVAKIVDIERFATPNKLVNYFGIFPEEERSGVDRQGQPLPAAPRHMSRKGNDLVRGYLWNASRVAVRHNPAIRALYRRLKARGKRGDVAVGHCMRKLLHLVFAVWKTDRPFDAKHFPWEDADTSPWTAATPDDAATTSSSAMKMAVNPAGDGTPRAAVAASGPAAEPAAHHIGPKPRRAAKDRPLVDFKFLRERVTMEQALRHLGLLAGLRGSGPQRRGPCPLHSHPGATERTFSVHMGKGAFRCFHAECGAEGNVLDLWAAIHRLPLYEAALHLAETLGLPRNREEEPVVGTCSPQVTTARPARTASRAGGPP